VLVVGERNLVDADDGDVEEVGNARFSRRLDQAFGAAHVDGLAVSLWGSRRVHDDVNVTHRIFHACSVGQVERLPSRVAVGRRRPTRREHVVSVGLESREQRRSSVPVAPVSRVRVGITWDFAPGHDVSTAGRVCGV